MKIRIVGITEPRIEGVNSANELIAYCARVSNKNNQLNSATAPKLLNFLVEEHHWSPFEMVHIVVEIETTRDIGRQILRHRSFSFQEFSQRYAEIVDPPVYREARLQDATNRQSSLETGDDAIMDAWSYIQTSAINVTSKGYSDAISLGIAKEVARAVMPEGMTPSVMYMSGTLRSWIHYVWLRSHPSTQKEHRQIALKVAELLAAEFESVPVLEYTCADQEPLRFDTTNGRPIPPISAVKYRKQNKVAWLYNPWTSNMRSLEDVGRDPYGYYIGRREK